MSTASKREIYFSFFMFTADLRPDDTNYTEVLIRHLQGPCRNGLRRLRYAYRPPVSERRTIGLRSKAIVRLKKAFDKAGLKNTKFATNVGTTQFFDPTSPYKEQRDHALSYLKSRVDITSVLGGESTNRSCPGRSSIPTVSFR